MTVTLLRVLEKTNEITCFSALLDPYDLQGVIVTGDAAHPARARPLPRRGEESPVRRHRVAEPEEPYEQLRPCPGQATAKFYDCTTGHGGKETRVGRALTVTGLGVDFPHVAQAARVVRHRTDTRTGKQSRDRLRDH